MPTSLWNICQKWPTPVRYWSYSVTSISYAFGRWRFGRVILAWRIATASRPTQNHWQCWQLHNGLFGRRQSHGLSAIAELLVNFWHLDTLALSPECQSAQMSEIKNRRLELGATEHLKCNHMMTLGFYRVKCCYCNLQSFHQGDHCSTSHSSCCPHYRSGSGSNKAFIDIRLHLGLATLLGALYFATRYIQPTTAKTWRHP